MADWIEEYISHLRKHQKSEASALKEKHLPDSFFKYRGLNEYTLNCLEKGTIWLSPADKLNDPFESSLFFNTNQFFRKFFSRLDFGEQFKKNLDAEISPQEIDDILSHDDCELRFQQICATKGIDRDFNASKIERERLISNYIARVKRDMRVCSFSERSDSILMWSHYADSHKGICIAYDFRQDEIACHYIEPVHYTDKIFDITSFIGKEHVPLKIAAISKAVDWQYEKEWRMTFPSRDENPNNGHYSVPKPIAIYLGSNFSENPEGSQNRLQEVAKSNAIPLIQMGIHSSDFKIIPVAK